jgi:hypothetical protein
MNYSQVLNQSVVHMPRRARLVLPGIPWHIIQRGNNRATRLASYRDLFASPVDPELVTEIRSATDGNYAPGNDRFKSEIGQTVRRRVTRGKPGRPAKTG